VYSVLHIVVGTTLTEVSSRHSGWSSTLKTLLFTTLTHLPASNSRHFKRLRFTVVVTDNLRYIFNTLRCIV